MGRSLWKLATLAVGGSAFAPLVTLVASRYMQDHVFPCRDLPVNTVIGLGICGVCIAFHWLLRRSGSTLEHAATE